MDYIYAKLCSYIEEKEYKLPIASTTTLGGVKIDGSSITINSTGTISANIPSDILDHTRLTNRDALNQHPISSIVGLQSELDEKGDYSKPLNGIPYDDLSNEVKDSLDKADTALQEHQSLEGIMRFEDITQRIVDAGKQDEVIEYITDNLDDGYYIYTETFVSGPYAEKLFSKMYIIKNTFGDKINILTFNSDGDGFHNINCFTNSESIISISSDDNSIVIGGHSFLNTDNASVEIKKVICSTTDPQWSIAEKSAAMSRLGVTDIIDNLESKIDEKGGKVELVHSNGEILHNSEVITFSQLRELLTVKPDFVYLLDGDWAYLTTFIYGQPTDTYQYIRFASTVIGDLRTKTSSIMVQTTNGGASYTVTSNTINNENVSNKSDMSVLNDTRYPTTKAVADYVTTQLAVIPWAEEAVFNG